MSGSISTNDEDRANGTRKAYRLAFVSLRRHQRLEGANATQPNSIEPTEADTAQCNI
jgi:hypothetical protein